MTVIAAVPPDRIPELRAEIEALGNPARLDLRNTLDAIEAIHFASINVFTASAGDRGHLVFEFSGDGDPDDLLRILDERLSPELSPLFADASDRGSGSLYDFWKSRIVTVGQSPFSNPGVNFSGTPDFTVTRIKRESALAAHLASYLSQSRPAAPALQLLTRIREDLRKTPWAWALEPAPLAQGGAPDLPKSFAEAVPVIGLLAGPFAKTFLWPLLIPAIVAFGLVWWLSGLGRAVICAVLVAVLTLASGRCRRRVSVRHAAAA